jgi:hypothetical protein
VTFFITTFAPFYPHSNSRYSFDAEDCFLLFQPEISFASHNLPADTPVTNWTSPQTVRDKIRVAYRTAGREYFIRNTVRYPMCHDMIKPLSSSNDSDSELVNWWKYKDLFAWSRIIIWSLFVNCFRLCIFNKCYSIRYIKYAYIQIDKNKNYVYIIWQRWIIDFLSVDASESIASEPNRVWCLHLN